MRPPAQVLSELFDALAVLMAKANPTDQDVHNTDIAKVKEQIAQAKTDLAAEDTRMVAERAALDTQAYRLMLDQSASHEVMRRKHRSRLPPVFEARDLFNTPGPRAGNPLEGNRAEAPGTGAPVQPRQMDPPRQNTVIPQDALTPPGHYSNPMDNLVAAAARLEAIPTGSILVQPRPDPLDPSSKPEL